MRRTVERVFLIGYRGTGKSTVARLLAERLGWQWIDGDDYLQSKHNATIRRIFEEEGEASFRAKEADVLVELCLRAQCVIATGGGVVLSEANRRRLKKEGICIWLKADAATLFERLRTDSGSDERRPPLTALPQPQEIESLLALREPFYRECADLTIDAAALSPEDVIKQIGTWLDHARHD